MKILANSRGSKTALVYICWNERAASRGHDENTFSIEKYKFSDIGSLFMYAASIVEGYSDVSKFIEEYEYYGYDEDQLVDVSKDILEDQDYGAGYPVVYGIQVNGDWVFLDDSFDHFEMMRLEDR